MSTGVLKPLAVAAAGLLALAAGASAARGAQDPAGDLAGRIEKMYGPAAGPAFAREELDYRIEAGALGQARGAVRWSSKSEEIGGRTVLRLRQEISVSGRRQESEALLDAAGLFPYEYTRAVTGPDGQTHRDSVLWDHLGGRLFCEARTERDGKTLSIRDQQERRLGTDLPAELLDPLSTMMLYRLRSAGAGKAVPWSVPVIEGCDEIFACAFTPRGAQSFAGTPARGQMPLAGVDQTLTPRSPGLRERKISLTLELGGRFVPRRYTEPLGGSVGTMTLTGSRAQ